MPAPDASHVLRSVRQPEHWDVPAVQEALRTPQMMLLLAALALQLRPAPLLLSRADRGPQLRFRWLLLKFLPLPARDVLAFVGERVGQAALGA